jgi:hypothetical protein
MQDFGTIEQVAGGWDEGTDFMIPAPWNALYRSEIGRRRDEIYTGAKPMEYTDRAWHMHSGSDEEHTVELLILQESFKIDCMLVSIFSFGLSDYRFVRNAKHFEQLSHVV